jgi:hypothetical protein
VIECHVTADHETECHVIECHVTAGHVTADHETEGYETEGHVTEGHVTEGHVTEGHVTEGHVTEGRVTEVHVRLPLLLRLRLQRRRVICPTTSPAVRASGGHDCVALACGDASMGPPGGAIQALSATLVPLVHGAAWGRRCMPRATSQAAALAQFHLHRPRRRQGMHAAYNDPPQPPDGGGVERREAREGGGDTARGGWHLWGARKGRGAR